MYFLRVEEPSLDLLSKAGRGGEKWSDLDGRVAPRLWRDEQGELWDQGKSTVTLTSPGLWEKTAARGGQGGDCVFIFTLGPEGLGSGLRCVCTDVHAQ